ncbi:MAG: ABC transporter ATP-binding protein [Lachnospiraceae bacterium]|nr:ABC transporter ATP-binding protein [Lachnospiraceae bacterium]
MIRTHDLYAGYQDAFSIHCPDISFADGCLTAVVGENGSGKSTLLRTLAGIAAPVGGEAFASECACDYAAAVSSGKKVFSDEPAGETAAAPAVLSGEENIFSMEPSIRARRISYLPQSRNVPEISAYRLVLHGRFPYLSWPRRYRKEDEEEAERCMQEMGVYTLRDRRLSDLSGGERQRVYLAMLLAQNAGNVLMDEPATYLDIHHQMRLMEMSKKLAAEGRCVIMVMHDLLMALQYADRIAVVSDQTVTEPMEPEKAFSSGILERTFGVRIGRISTADGWRYYYETVEGTAFGH